VDKTSVRIHTVYRSVPTNPGSESQKESVTSFLSVEVAFGITAQAEKILETSKILTDGSEVLVESFTGQLQRRIKEHGLPTIALAAEVPLTPFTSKAPGLQL